ncbi:MAG: flagellar biosynthesis anti-sigma factor FlgM [Deltaproteobacteria bacterium]|nr:flagellar biosynthesis anti-sigma factor FlgM [Deltaproteobacteria bacterium]
MNRISGQGPSTTDRARDTGSAGAVSGGKDRRRSGKSEDAGSSEGAEKVAISGRAKDIARAMEAANFGPEIDEAKVARFKAAIQNGSYKVDTDKVADRMVDEHLANMF